MPSKKVLRKTKKISPASPAPAASAGMRLALGRVRDEAMFPAPPAKSALPADYGTLLSEIKRRLAQSRSRVMAAANSVLVITYWEIGKMIHLRQSEEGWGSGTIDRLSFDLKKAFPEMSGLSARNLSYMRSFAAAWPDFVILQRIVAKLPWRQNLTLLEKVADSETRLWYAEKTLENAWSQPALLREILRSYIDRKSVV